MQAGKASEKRQAGAGRQTGGKRQAGRQAGRQSKASRTGNVKQAERTAKQATGPCRHAGQARSRSTPVNTNLLLIS